MKKLMGWRVQGGAADWDAAPTGRGVGEDVRDLQERVRELEKMVRVLMAERLDRHRTVNKRYGGL